MSASEVGVPQRSTPRLSVVVPTYNRLPRLRRVLESLAAQDLPESFEVVVVSDGSTDGTNEYISGATPLPIVGICQPNRGPAAARNTGIEHASGDIVVFIDDDVVPDVSLLRHHLEEHLHLGPDIVVIGPMMNPPDHVFQPWVAWEQQMLAKQYHAMAQNHYQATARQFYTGNASIRRSHLRANGGFDEQFRRAEDVELAYRLADAGLTFHFSHDAVGYHYADRSYQSWRETAYAYGRADIVFAKGEGREWIHAFIARGHRRRAAPLRSLLNVCHRSPLFRRLALLTLELPIHFTRVRLPAPLLRGALSGVYAIEYQRGLSDEIGSEAAYRDLIGRGDSTRGP